MPWPTNLHQPYVKTKNGKCTQEEMGVTDVHKHLWIELSHHRQTDYLRQKDFEKILAEFAVYRSAGGQTVFDCQPLVCGQNSEKLIKLSKGKAVKVVACTGFHQKKYYSREYYFWKADADKLTSFFCDEPSQGMKESKSLKRLINPSFFKAASEQEFIAMYQPLLEGSINASIEMKCLLMIHTDLGADAEKIVEYIQNIGMSCRQLLIYQMDKRPATDLHASLAKSEVLMQNCTFFRKKYAPEKTVWLLIGIMISSGYEDFLALASGMVDCRTWKVFGGEIGMAGFTLYIKGRFADIEIEPSVIEKMMGKNITKCLKLKNYQEKLL